MVLKSLDWWAISMGRVCTMSTSNGIWQRLMHIGNNTAKIAPHICSMQTTSYLQCDNTFFPIFNHDACIALLTTLEGLNAIHHFIAVLFDINDDCCLFLLLRFFRRQFNFVTLLAFEAFSCHLTSCEMLRMARFFHFSFKASATLDFLFAFYRFPLFSFAENLSKENTFLLVNG